MFDGGGYIALDYKLSGTKKASKSCGNEVRKMAYGFKYYHYLSIGFECENFWMRYKHNSFIVFVEEKSDFCSRC